MKGQTEVTILIHLKHECIRMLKKDLPNASQLDVMHGKRTGKGKGILSALNSKPM
jgi:hypothetical protein